MEEIVEEKILINARDISLQIDQRQILNNISLQIAEEQIVTLIGPNGAGKTSLVKIVLGLIHPSSGEVIQKKGLRIGYMPQRLHIEPSMPVSVDRFLKLAVNANKNEIARVLEEVGATRLIHSQLPE